MKPGKIATGDAAAHPSRFSFFTSYRFACSSSASRAIAASSERACWPRATDSILTIFFSSSKVGTNVPSACSSTPLRSALLAPFRSPLAAARRLRSSSLSRVEDVLRLLERHVDGFCSFYGGFEVFGASGCDDG